MLVRTMATFFRPSCLTVFSATIRQSTGPEPLHRCTVGRSPMLEKYVVFMYGIPLSLAHWAAAWIEKLVVVLRERAQTLVEMADKAAPFFQEVVIMDQEAAKKFLTAVVRPAFARLVAALDQTSVFEHDALEQGFKSVLAETGLSMGKLAQPVRVALTGTTVSPGIFDVMALLGRKRTLARLKKAIDLMG